MLRHCLLRQLASRVRHRAAVGCRLLAMAAIALCGSVCAHGADWILGMEELHRLDRLPVFRGSQKIGSVSSYDRTGGNDDGFSGKYSFVRREEGGLVLADLQGPGIIYRIWTPTPTDDWFEFFFDGEREPRLKIRFRDLFLGTHPRFPQPLAGFGAGGFVSYVPLPFARSCKVVARAERIQFYQINYALYPPEAPVETFAAQASPRELEHQNKVCQLWMRGGSDLSAHVVAPGASLERVKTNVTLHPGQSTAVYASDRPGRLAGIRLSPADALGGKARDLLLRISFDGEAPAVNCPLGDFFGYAWGEPAMKSLLVGATGGSCYSHFPMPFDRSVRVEIVSERRAGPPIPVQAEVAFSPLPRRADEGKFYAVWRRENPTRAGVPFTFIDTAGRGHLVGVALQAQGTESGNTLFFEGDDQATIDGELVIHGTGSEDFFNGGWYDVPDRWERRISFPLSGCLGYQKHLGRTGGYRLFLGDAVSYRQSLLQTIEHGGEKNSHVTDYCGMTYLYSEQRPTADLTPPALERRAVQDFREILIEVAWQTPILGFSFDRATISRGQAKIDGQDVRYLSYRVAGRDWAGDPFLYVSCELPVAGEYEVLLEGVRGPECGRVQLFRNEAPAGTPVDLFATAPARSGRLALGQLALEEGKNNLMLKIVGKPETASAFGMDLIRIICRRTDMTAESSPALRRILQPGPLVIAHRGFSARAPENTLPSFRLALAARADLVELDFHAAADGTLVVLHDGTLDRTTDAIARWGGKEHAVSRRNLDELAALDAGRWFGAAYADTRIPTLAEAVETIQRGGCTLIERKGGSAAALVSLLQERGWLDTVVVQSFDWAFVKQARALAPHLVLGALGPPSSWNGRRLTDPEKALNPEFLDAVVQTGSQLVVWNAMVDAAAIRQAHDRGLRIWIYTIDKPDEAARLVREGADGIITNDPELIRAQLLPAPDEARAPVPGRTIPRPLADHPGNIYLEGETVRVRLPEELPAAATHWRLRTEQPATVRAGPLAATDSGARAPLDLGPLGIGWYRIEFGTPDQPDMAWTAAAVLRPLDTPVPGDSPVAVDGAISWFARNDPVRQRQFANLAALAGVNWIRDRLRWSDLQPAEGPLVAGPTTYDTAAEAQHAAGLKVLQVFHDTPRWAREAENEGGRFAADLRYAYALGRALAERFRGRVAAWEPWNEANVATFGGHTVDQMCSWQKAFWLGCKQGDPEVTVGWNATAAVPTPAHTEGVLANETWPYYDTYNIHTYDWSHAYAGLWAPAREATAGRPLWITEADRGTPHLKQAPWYDQDPRLEQLKAEWIPQSYACSLFSGSRRHFHFILGHYHEPNAIQFGLLRLDLTPRPGYVALAAAGRCLAGARVLGRWQPRDSVNVYAFRAWPDGQEQDVLVVWAEKEVDWDARGKTTADWALPTNLVVRAVVDHLGRARGQGLPRPLTSAPCYVFLPPGQAATLPLEPPPALAHHQPGEPSPIVLQFSLPRAAGVRVEDLPWSEGYAYGAQVGETLELPVQVYCFGQDTATGSLRIESQPEGWATAITEGAVTIRSRDRTTRTLRVQVPASAKARDGWVVLRGEFGALGRPVVAARVRAVSR